MRSVKRYNLSQNAGFNNARTAADRRAYRAILKQRQLEDPYPGGNPMWDAYMAALLKAGNKAASFPSLEEWSNTRHDEDM